MSIVNVIFLLNHILLLNQLIKEMIDLYQGLLLLLLHLHMFFSLWGFLLLAFMLLFFGCLVVTHIGWEVLQVQKLWIRMLLLLLLLILILYLGRLIQKIVRWVWMMISWFTIEKLLGHYLLIFNGRLRKKLLLWLINPWIMIVFMVVMMVMSMSMLALWLSRVPNFFIRVLGRISITIMLNHWALSDTLSWLVHLSIQIYTWSLHLLLSLKSLVICIVSDGCSRHYWETTLPSTSIIRRQ
jgi:hypothetical protein